MTEILIMFAIFFVSFVSFFISHILDKETFSKVCLAISYHGWYLKETVIAEIAKEMLE